MYPLFILRGLFSQSLDVTILTRISMCLMSIYTYNYIMIQYNTMGATCRAGTAYHSGASEFTPSFGGVLVARSVVFCVMLCCWLFVLLSVFFWPLSVLLQLSAFVYFIGIFKRFLVLVVFVQVSPQVLYWIFILIFHRFMNRNWLPCVLNE